MHRRLLIRPGGIGDCILCMPVMQQLASPETEVWAPTAVLPLFTWASRCRGISSTGIELLGVGDTIPPAHLVATLQNFDSIFSWYGENRPEFREAALRIHPQWRFLPALPPRDEQMHATDFFARTAQAGLGLTPHIPVPQTETRPSIVIHPFSGGKRKNWDLSRFHELARQLPLAVEWLAGPEEALDGAYRCDDLLELAAWIRGARLYIGNDSGISHLAAATDVPALLLFGATDARIWAPRNRNVRVIQRKSMEEIAIADVLTTARQMLAV